MSSGVPIRPSGTLATISSLKSLRVCLIILVAKAPHARVLTLIPSRPSRDASTLERLKTIESGYRASDSPLYYYMPPTHCCSAAFEVEYA